MVKDIILDLFSEFARGTLDVSRLNYGIISLIPKVPGAADIRQFRPITILNVILSFEIVTLPKFVFCHPLVGILYYVFLPLCSLEL